MASTCDACGYRNSEVCSSLPIVSFLFSFLRLQSCTFVQLKPGGRIPEKGKKISLTVKNVNDLSRDVIKVSMIFI